MKAKYTIIKPKGFKKVKLPRFNEWVAALESGKFRRGTDHLCKRENKQLKYCCLGVLCKLQGVLKQPEPRQTLFLTSNGETDTLSTSNEVYNVLGRIGSLPPDCYVIFERTSNHLTNLASINDSDLVSFKQIAEIIREFWTE